MAVNTISQIQGRRKKDTLESVADAVNTGATLLGGADKAIKGVDSLSQASKLSFGVEGENAQKLMDEQRDPIKRRLKERSY